MLDDFAVDVLAAHRLTVLATRDRITGPVRWRLIRWSYKRTHGDAFVVPLDHTADKVAAEDPDPPKLAYFVHCMWCFGLWVCVAAVVLKRVWPAGWRFARWALAMSSMVALIDQQVND
jgi:hypothetical protein